MNNGIELFVSSVVKISQFTYRISKVLLNSDLTNLIQLTAFTGVFLDSE